MRSVYHSVNLVVFVPFPVSPIVVEVCVGELVPPIRTTVQRA